MITTKRIVVGPMEANCFIVRDEATGRCAIIDPGSMNDALCDAIEEAGADKFDYILLTHCHFDHVGAVCRVKDLIDVPVAIHKDDADGLRDPYMNLSGPLGGRKTIYPEADIRWTDNQTFRLGETEFTVLHTPGHTAGSCCYRTEGVIFAGDTLFYESVGRTDFPGGSMRQMRESLERLLGLEGDYLVYAGHYQHTTLSHERECNPYIHL